MNGLCCLAVDFGGTLARPGPDPDGQTVAAALAAEDHIADPRGFAAAFDSVRLEVRDRDQRSCEQTPFSDVLTAAALRCGETVRDPLTATELVFRTVADAEIDPRAAQTLRRLHSQGWRCVLASNTQRPKAIRHRTLVEAEIRECFSGLVLSSALGVRKPHPTFYEEVIKTADSRPDQILFVGDTPAKDIIGPSNHGMRAVLVAPTQPQHFHEVPTTTPRISHFAELPALLERWHDR